MAQKNTRNLS